MIITNRLLTVFSKHRNTYIYAFILGLILGISIFTFIEKEYEAYFEIKLGEIKSDNFESNFLDYINKPIPFILDAQRSLKNPETLPENLLESCGLNNTNQSRKYLVNSILVNRIYSDTGLSFRIRLKDNKTLKTCAFLISNYLLNNFNGRIDQILSELSSDENWNKINKKIIYSTLSRDINFSDNYVFPDLYKIVLLVQLLIFLGLTLYFYRKNL